MNRDKKAVNISVEPLRSYDIIHGQSHNYKKLQWPDIRGCRLESNIDPKITNFLESLSFDGYVLAGNSVANMIENKAIQGDLDLWVTDKSKYISVLNELGTYNPTCYELYHSMIIIRYDDLPEINLILSDSSAEETAESFDFDYCRCYYTNKTGCIASYECLESIFTKNICNEICWRDIRLNRILKAIRYGYKFTTRFWREHNELLASLEKVNQTVICDICRVNKFITQKKYIKFSDAEHNCFNKVGKHLTDVNILIEESDLNEEKFKQKEIKINITNCTNIEKTIFELKQIFEKYRGLIKTDLKLPMLFSFKPDMFDYAKIYALKIIMLNPVRDGNYLEVKFDQYVDDRPLKYRYYEDIVDGDSNNSME